MAVLKLLPFCKNYLWGGTKLKTLFHKSYEGDVLAETWELSCNKDGESTISGGPFDGMTLSGFIEKQGKQILGQNCVRFGGLPVLVKLIDAKEKLSVQVHPNDEYARRVEGQNGKTEMWYVADADDGAFLYCGFIKKTSKEELRQLIGQDALLPFLKSFKVKKGDVFFIEAGTVHAIGEGIVIAEIQQNSNVTYRVCDYGRYGPDGKKRELHIEKALDVMNLSPQTKEYDFGGHLAKSDYFTVDIVNVDTEYKAAVSEKSFLHLLFLDGEGFISDQDGGVSFQKGDSVFICAGSGDVKVSGKCQALITTVPE